MGYDGDKEKDCHKNDFTMKRFSTSIHDVSGELLLQLSG
jgi:hypothetical protein